MSLVAILKLLLILSVVLMVFSIALRAKASDALYFVREWRLGLRAFVAIFVVVPVVAVVMARLLDLNPVVKLAMVALAFSPLPPILPNKQIRAGGRACYVTGLLVFATVVSIVVTPLGLWLTGQVFDVDIAISPRRVAMTVGITVLIPLIAGFIGGAVLGSAVPTVSNIASKLGTGLLVAIGLLLLVKMAPAMWHLVGQGTLVALLAMAVAGLAAGYLLAGDSKGDRITLSLAAATRHPGVAIAIAMQNFPEAELAPAAIVLGLLLSILISIPYMRLMKGQETAESA